jgi:hypothetical protein
MLDGFPDPGGKAAGIAAFRGLIPDPRQGMIKELSRA